MSEEEKINECSQVLDRIINDNSIPKNIRRAAKEAKKELINGEGDLTVNATNAISELNDINEDPNIPIHARTKIWDAISLLEELTLEK
ncbi:hypothetical protein C9439_08255 [archaeon SCG-AAA382B04]|nr:hypothetical protein C9439_08255 [archaeon SCG-AAA382B04]